MSTADWFRGIADALQEAQERPYGPPVEGNEKTLAGQACVALCAGDADQARTLWKLIANDLGYMPRAAAVALIRGTSTTNLVPDVEAPEPT